MAVATVVFIGGVIYGVIRETFWRLRKKKEGEQFCDFHKAMHKISSTFVFILGCIVMYIILMERSLNGELLLFVIISIF